MQESNIDQFHQNLFTWWREQGRVLPWREKGVGERGEVKGDRETMVSKQVFRRDVAGGLHEQTGLLHVGRDVISYVSAQTIREQVFQEYFASESQRDPYRVVVAEIMLQQTQVDRVMPKYLSWMEKWPTIGDLSRVTQAEVIIEWKGLGYNRRARFLWLLAKEIVENRNEVWPQSEKELLKLPGIGRYTARAVMSFAFGQQVGVVDVNVRRVISRWLGVTQHPTKTPVVDPEYSGLETFIFKELGLTFQDDGVLNEMSFFDLADSILPASLADPWNQALMDFGALVCTAKSPKCEICPIAHICSANQFAITNGYGNYKEFLASSISKPSKNNERAVVRKGKDYANGKKLKFEDTDRFLRGKIIDALREKSWKEEEILQYLSTKYTQFNSDQIRANIQGLANEQLITKVKDELKI